MTRIECPVCGFMITPEEAERTGGICLECYDDGLETRFQVWSDHATDPIIWENGNEEV